MATIKYGQGVADASGSVGGTVFSRNANGAYIRNRTHSTRPKTPLQTLSNSRFGATSTGWNSLTDAERAAWTAFAASGLHPHTGPLGNAIALTGPQAYAQAQGVAALWQVPVPSQPPAVITPLPSLADNGSIALFNPINFGLQSLIARVKGSAYPLSYRVEMAPLRTAGSMRPHGVPFKADGGGGTGKGDDDEEPEPGGGGLQVVPLYRTLYGRGLLSANTVIWLRIVATAIDVPFFGPPLHIRVKAAPNV